MLIIELEIYGDIEKRVWYFITGQTSTCILRANEAIARG